MAVTMRATNATTTDRRVVVDARERGRGRARRGRTTRARAAAATKPWGERDCRLVLEDGSVWPGRAFGATKTMVGEVVFNTSLSGCVRTRSMGGGGRGRGMMIRMGFSGSFF
jgi:Carbamoylphosphate synthase small subunit